MSRSHLAYRIGILCLVLTFGLPGVRMAPSVAVAVAAFGNIVGHVTDSTGQPIPGAFVRIVPQSGGPATQTTSDSHGAYKLENLPEDTYRVDFTLAGFGVTRRNAVQVRAGASDSVDAVLFPRPHCECVTIEPPTTARLLAGRVVDEADRPLPGARLEIVGPMRREASYADSEGHFFVRIPVDGKWSITASESGFRSVSQQVAGGSAGPLVLRVRYAGTQGLPDTERFAECECPASLFAHGER